MRQDDDYKDIGDSEQEVHVAPEESLPLSSSPYSDWSARLFTAGRVQYIVVTNTSSLYSVLMPGRGITDQNVFIQRSLTAIRDQLAADNLSFLFKRLVAPEADQVAFSRALNQSVTGSLNDIVRHAKFSLAERGLSPHDAAKLLARYPMGALGYAFPKEAFAEMSPTMSNDQVGKCGNNT